MQCREVLERIEPIAAGELELVPDEVRAHLETCPRCASALASAQRLESALRAIEVPPAPAAFTAAVLQRVRRDRWRSEQRVDRLFNLAIAAAVLVIVAGVAAMMNVDGVLTVTGSAWTLLRDGAREAARAFAPTFATYVAAAGLLALALVMWSWAERRLGF
jgi:anti-sigma factor RsiW